MCIYFHLHERVRDWAKKKKIFSLLIHSPKYSKLWYPGLQVYPSLPVSFRYPSTWATTCCLPDSSSRKHILKYFIKMLISRGTVDLKNKTVVEIPCVTEECLGSIPGSVSGIQLPAYSDPGKWQVMYQVGTSPHPYCPHWTPGLNSQLWSHRGPLWAFWKWTSRWDHSLSLSCSFFFSFNFSLLN